MDVFSMLIDMVKSNGAITQLQQDIVETIRELEKQQFDKFSVENRIIKNSENHQDLFNAYGLLPLAMQNISQQPRCKQRGIKLATLQSSGVCAPRGIRQMLVQARHLAHCSRESI